jgi:hypothetical protein
MDQPMDTENTGITAKIVRTDFPHSHSLPVEGRAETDEQKREVLDKLYALWCSDELKGMRLGQVLLNVFPAGFYYTEDQGLVERLYAYYKS